MPISAILYCIPTVTMTFKLRRSGPSFDIETEKDSFPEWKTQWEAFTFNSGLSDIADKTVQQKHTLMALREALSRETLRTVKNLNLSDDQQNIYVKHTAAKNIPRKTCHE